MDSDLMRAAGNAWGSDAGLGREARRTTAPPRAPRYCWGTGSRWVSRSFAAAAAVAGKRGYAVATAARRMVVGPPPGRSKAVGPPRHAPAATLADTRIQPVIAPHCYYYYCCCSRPPWPRPPPPLPCRHSAPGPFFLAERIWSFPDARHPKPPLTRAPLRAGVTTCMGGRVAQEER